MEFEQRLKDLPPNNEQVYEPFGFADGVSQPILRDTPRARSAHNAEHVVDAGEFVLGYPDNSGYLPSTPTVRPERDPHRMLAEMAPPQPGVQPSFTRGGSDGRRDFGRDGTFLVVRHLEQDQRAFHDFAEAEARRLSADASCPFAGMPRDDLQEVLEAKMVGRWADGGSLVRHAHPARENAARPTMTSPLAVKIRRGSPVRSARISAVPTRATAWIPTPPHNLPSAIAIGSSASGDSTRRPRRMSCRNSCSCV